MDRSFDSIILNSLAEDAPGGDMTTLCTVSESAAAHGYFIAKEAGIIAGTDIAKRVFDLVGDGVETVFFVKEGDKAEKGQRIGEISGPARTVLTGERTALNLMQRASGIATATAEAVGRVSGTNAKICDTRKTMPGLRALDKYAVRIGGGTNHRFNLSDGILIKDNHIAAAGGITAAVSAARARAPHTLKIEVEVETFDQLREALNAKADIIMLDNMSVEDMRTAVGITAGRAPP